MAERVFQHQLDAKKRMRIPAQIKSEIGNNYSITIGTGRCLYILTAAQFDDMDAKLRKRVSMFNTRSVDAARKFLAGSWNAVEDQQGRIRIPDHLLNYAGITKDVVTIKSVGWYEIWSKEAWDKMFNAESIDFNALNDTLDDLCE